MIVSQKKKIEKSDIDKSTYSVYEYIYIHKLLKNTDPQK